jgi:hypothetical protein
MPFDVAFVRVLGPIQVVTTSGLALDVPSASQRRCFGDTIVVASQGPGHDTHEFNDGDRGV